jgi:hypothetical protein
VSFARRILFHGDIYIYIFLLLSPNRLKHHAQLAVPAIISSRNFMLLPFV